MLDISGPADQGPDFLEVIYLIFNNFPALLATPGISPHPQADDKLSSRGIQGFLRDGEGPLRSTFPVSGKGSLIPAFSPGEKVLRYEADEGFLRTDQPGLQPEMSCGHPT